MKQSGAIARPYAKALFQVARSSGRAGEVGAELALFHGAMAAEHGLEEFLLRPWVKGSTKKAVVSGVADRLGCSKLVRDFLGLLAARGRVGHLAEIIQAYRNFQDTAEGRVQAQVRSAVGLTDGERGRLVASLARIAGKAVVVEESVDSTLLGGFVAQIGSLVVDGSLDGQLARMRERLVRG